MTDIKPDETDIATVRAAFGVSESYARENESMKTVAKLIATARLQERESAAVICDDIAKNHERREAEHDEELDCYESQQELNKKIAAKSCAEKIRSQT